MANKIKAEIHSRNIGREKTSDSSKIIAEAKSIPLNASPVMINIPFKSKSPAQKRMNCIGTLIPKISIRNATPLTKSIPPSTFTNTIS